MKNKQADLFDHLAGKDKLYDYPPKALAKINALVPDKGPTLDVGCGDGVIGQAYDAPLTFGFDIAPRCVALANARGVRAVVADAAAPFPFADQSFQTVYCIALLHHLHYAWENIFTEMDRVLKPGGALVIVEPDIRNPLVKWTQAPASPIRTAPYDNEPAIHPDQLLPHLDGRNYTYTCDPINIEARQLTPSPFPLWNRLLKAPFVLTLALLTKTTPNKFAITATKGQ